MKLTITFPHRGTPPPDQPGYERESGDPYIFHKIWKSCLYHGVSCAGHECAFFRKKINQLDCEDCIERISLDEI